MTVAMRFHDGFVLDGRMFETKRGMASAFFKIDEGGHIDGPLHVISGVLNPDEVNIGRELEEMATCILPVLGWGRHH